MAVQPHIMHILLAYLLLEIVTSTVLPVNPGVLHADYVEDIQPYETQVDYFIKITYYSFLFH